jgi:hypothetical protein
MRRSAKVAGIAVAVSLLGFLLHELIHVHVYGHLAPLGLHADVRVTTSNDILGVNGIAKIYDARLTNYGILPVTIVVCEYLVSSAPGTSINYVVERWDPHSGRWVLVPEWDLYGGSLFCRPAFEVTGEHLAERRLWPGQSMKVGQGIPGMMGGFHIGDVGRFTIFLSPNGDRSKTVSTSAFLVDQQPKTTNEFTPDAVKPAGR